MVMQSHVEDSGNLLLVADPRTIRDELLQLDLEAAHQRTQLKNLWREQVEYITTSLRRCGRLPAHICELLKAISCCSA